MAADPPEQEVAALARTVGVELSAAACAQLVAYARLVCRWQRLTNLTGARDPRQFIHEHIVDCLAVVPHLAGGRMLDAGSGAGLPGIVIAIARPDIAVTLLEPRARRSRFLTQAVIELGLGATQVVCARLEAFSEDVDTVITRALGSLVEFTSAAGRCRQHGARLVAMKARLDEAELVAAQAVAGPAEIITLDVPGFAHRALVVYAPPTE